MKINKNIGSDFEEFLNEEGILEETKRNAIKKILEKQIADKAGKFSLNEVYQIAWDTKKTFENIKEILEELITEEKVIQLYFNPFEKRTDKLPIGEDSYEVYLIVNNKINKTTLKKELMR